MDFCLSDISNSIIAQNFSSWHYQLEINRFLSSRKERECQDNLRLVSCLCSSSSFSFLAPSLLLVCILFRFLFSSFWGFHDWSDRWKSWFFWNAAGISRSLWRKRADHHHSFSRLTQGGISWRYRKSSPPSYHPHWPLYMWRNHLRLRNTWLVEEIPSEFCSMFWWKSVDLQVFINEFMHSNFVYAFFFLLFTLLKFISASYIVSLPFTNSDRWNIVRDVITISLFKLYTTDAIPRHPNTF